MNGCLHGAVYLTFFVASIGVNLSYTPKFCMFLCGAAYYHESSSLVDTNTRIQAYCTIQKPYKLVSLLTVGLESSTPVLVFGVIDAKFVYL